MQRGKQGEALVPLAKGEPVAPLSAGVRPGGALALGVGAGGGKAGACVHTPSPSAPTPLWHAGARVICGGRPHWILPPAFARGGGEA